MEMRDTNNKNYNNLRDVTLLEEFINKFFEKDYYKFYKIILSKLNRYNNFSNIEPNDLLNEVISNILSNNVNFENYEHFRNYLRIALFNRIISIKSNNWYKIKKNSDLGEKITKNVDETDEFEIDENDIPDSNDYNEIFDNEIDKEELTKKLRNILTDRDFEIFILIQEGYIRKEIIEKLGISGKEYNNAYRRIQRKIK